MKRLWLLLFLIPAQLFAVSNLNLNGSGTATITSLPAEVVMTCNLAATGNDVDVEIFLDIEGNGVLDLTDNLVSYAVITDGIGWIIDPDNREEDILGDENGRDGTLMVTTDFEQDLDIMTQGQFIVQVTDKDGSTATALLIVSIPSSPPYIIGKVTEEGTGNPVAMVLVTAEETNNEESVVGAITDVNGDYSLNVAPGNYMVSAYSTVNMQYKGSDSLDVTVGANETKTVNLEMKPFPAFVEGHVKKEDGTPVPNVILMASSTDYQDFSFYFGFTNEQGYYKFGVEPGEIVVSAPTYAQVEISEDLFIDPSSDTTNVSAGQTATIDFTARVYTTFVEGVCTVDGSPLAGVEISGVATAILAEPPFIITDIYNTISKQDGTYKFGVSPGVETINIVMADKDGYTLVEPEFGYQSIAVTQGQTTTGVDFEFTGSGIDDNYIAGHVSYDGGGAASDIYVVAINFIDESRTGYRIQYTDASGNYRFNDIDSGDWKVGVYKSGYHSLPAISYVDTYFDSYFDNVDFVLMDGEVTGIQNYTNLPSPNAFELAQNYPNPFNMNSGMDHTSIRFTLDQQKQVDMSIFNIQGQLVKQVKLGNLPKGTHSIHWDGHDISGSQVPTGTYFYRVKAGNQVMTKPMTIIR